GREKICLRREWNNYRIPAIATSRYIRGLCHVISSNREQGADGTAAAAGSICLIFEWMDHIRRVSSFGVRNDSDLPKVICK
ncbi:hypothetical protein V8F44DRAFT_452082, partial [Aspergillus fumigatus]